MDKDEEAGLRAFQLLVGAYAGSAYPERPEWIEREGVRTDVADVESRWREEERVGFRVRMTDGSRFLVYYVPELDMWSGVRIADARHNDGAHATSGESGTAGPGQEHDSNT